MSDNIRTSVAALLVGASAAFTAATAHAVVSIDMIAAVGQTAPGSDGLAISSINAPFINGLGQVGFTGNLDNPLGGTIGYVWFNDGITWKNTDAVGNTLTGNEATMGISNTGNFIYSPSTDGEDSVWTANGLLLRGTDAAPGFPGEFATFNSRPIMLPDDTAYWVGGITGTQGGSTQGRVLWRADSAGAITPVFRTGDTIGGFVLNTVGVGFGFNVSQNDQHHIHRLQMDGVPTATNEFIYVDGALEIRQGDAVGDGTTYSSYGVVDINNNGTWAFSGVTAGGVAANSNFINVNGQIDHRRGTTIDGVTIGTGATVRGISLNNLDEMAFIWQTGSGASAEGTLFWGHTSNLAATSIALISLGDELDTTGDGVADAILRQFRASAVITGQGIALTDDGYVYFHAELLKIGSGELFNAMLRLQVPTPGAAAMMAIVGLAGVRRRR
ncbi:MAG: hypothetical protein EA379_06465 [Phycisphaerales bacterium]|nr:MAG: hypothetical protein EA379_06465 [Phycisphaerales bacterium]